MSLSFATITLKAPDRINWVANSQVGLKEKHQSIKKIDILMMYRVSYENILILIVKFNKLSRSKDPKVISIALVFCFNDILALIVKS